jgi:hypothetical protein
MQLNSGTLQVDYQKKIKDWIAKLSHQFLVSGIDYQQISFNESVNDVINTFVNKRKRLL